MSWKSILSRLSFVKPRRRAGKQWRLQCEILEDRLAPASVSQSGTQITFTLNANEALQVHAANANHYAFSSTANITGTVNAPSILTGAGTRNVTLITSSVTQINITDGGTSGVAGASVTFTDSAADYAEIIAVTLTNAGAGAIQFNGTSTFDGNLTALTTNGVTFNANSTVTMNGTGNVQASGSNTAVNFNGDLTVNSIGLKVKAGQTISQGSGGVIKTASTTDVSFTLTGAVGDILLGSSLNDLGGSIAFGQSGSGRVRDANLGNKNPTAHLPTINNLAIQDYTLNFENTEIVLPAGLTISGNLQVIAGSSIRETGPVSAGTGDFEVLKNGSILLDAGAGNSIPGSVLLDNHKSDNLTAVAYTGAAGVALQVVAPGLGSLTITALNGNITQISVLLQNRGGGAVTLNVAGAGNTVDLHNPNNQIEGPVTITGPVTTVNLGNKSTLATVPTIPASVVSLTLSFQNAPAVLPNLNLTTLSVVGQGIFQSAGAAVVATNASLSGSPLILTNSGNDFKNISVFAIGVSRSAITDVNAINFDGVSNIGDGTFDVTAGGAITEDSGVILQRSPAARATFTAGAGAAITLTGANQIAGVMAFHTTGAAGNVNISNFGVDFTLGTSSIGGNFTINARDVRQDPVSTLFVDGNTSITVFTTCALDNPGNSFTGSVALQGAIVSVRDSGPLDLGISHVTDHLTVRAAGAITQTGAITGNGIALFDAGTAAITLAIAGNDFNTVSALSTGAGAVAITDANALLIDRFNLGSGPLTLTSADLEENSTSSITQTAAATLTFNVSGSIHFETSDNQFLGPVALPGGVRDFALENQGDLSFVGAPNIAGGGRLIAGGVLTLPAAPLTSLDDFNFRARRIVVSEDLTAITRMAFTGIVDFQISGLTLTSPSILFNGDINPTGALTMNLGANGVLTYTGGTWHQGANPLTINGGGIFNIGEPSSSNFDFVATFNMVSGTIAMPGSASIVVNASGTFQVGGTSSAEVVTVNNNAGNITFMNRSVLSVGLGSVNDRLVKAGSGNININPVARLMSYAGLAGAAPSPVLVGTNQGFFFLTTDNGNAPHAFLMGTDIVQPAYSDTQLTIASGGTLAPNGIATGFESDSDKFKITAVRTGTTTGVPLVFTQDSNGLVSVAIRNAAVATTLTVTTTKIFGDGITLLGGVAVNGPGSVTINAPTADAAADILLAGPLVALTLRDYFASSIGLAVVRAGGTSAGATTITGRRFINIGIDLPTVLSNLTANLFVQNNNTSNFISAERFGTIKITPLPAANLSGDFHVSRLTNLNRANSTVPAITSAIIGGALGRSDALSVWDITGNVSSVTAARTENWVLGVAPLSGIPNVRNSEKLRNVGTLSLGSVTGSSVHAVGKVFNINATNWVNGALQAGFFGNIKIAGNGTIDNLGELDNVQLIATSNSGLSTTIGVPSFEALANLSVAGNSSDVTLRFLDGNATSIAVARNADHWNVTANVAPNGGAVVKLVAGAWDELTLDAKSAGTIATVGNVAANLFGDFSGEIVLHGTPGFSGVTLGALKVSRNMSDSSVRVENGGIGSISVTHSMADVNVGALGAAGAINSITAGEWTSPLDDNRDLVARNIGTLTITGAPQIAPGGFLAGDFNSVNVLAFLKSGNAPAIGALSVAGDYLFAQDGFLRADNGITTLKVNRRVTQRNFALSVISLLNSSPFSDVPGRIRTLTFGSWSGVDITAKTLGAVKGTGFFTPENPGLGFTAGDLTAEIDLFGATSAPLVPHVGLDSLNVNTMRSNLSAPFGITSLVAISITESHINTDNPVTGTAGRIGLLQAADIGDKTVIRAVTVGALTTVPNFAAGFTGDFDGVDLTVTGFIGPATAPVAVGTIAIAGSVFAGTINVPRSIKSLAIAGTASGLDVAAGFAANSSIGVLSLGSAAVSTFTSRAIGTMNVTNSFNTNVVTLTGNLAGVALGSFTSPGKVVGTTFNVTGGNVASFITGAFVSSQLFVGVHLPSPGDFTLANQSSWLSGSAFTLGTFKTTAVFDPANVSATASFRDSFVVAQKLGTIAISGLDPIVPKFSISFLFGIGFRGSKGAGPTITVNGLAKPVGFTVGNFIYADLDG